MSNNKTFHRGPRCNAFECEIVGQREGEKQIVIITRRRPAGASMWANNTVVTRWAPKWVPAATVGTMKELGF